MGSAAVGALDQALQKDPGFRSDLAAASSKEPPVNMSGYGDLAGWLMTQVSELRRAKQADVAAVGASGESHPSKLLGDKEAAELASFNYVSGCMLDVTTYRQAMEKFGEEEDVQEKQWRTLQEKYVGNLTRLHTAMQQSDVVYWEPPPAGWYEGEQDLVGKGCDCQCCAPAGLENHPGGKRIRTYVK